MLRQNTAVNKKHLICFFDINDTMYIGDSAKGVSKETAILKMLAEQYESVWDSSVTRQSMTFRDFIEKHLSPGDRRQPEIQLAHNRHYDNFISYLESKNHPLTAKIKDEFAIISSNLQGGNIPESFIRLVNYLEENHYSFTIIFRTFGKDIKDVEAELFNRTSLKKLNHASFHEGKLHVGEDCRLQTPKEIFNHIKPFEHAAWQDSFSDWRASGEAYSGGKPYPVDFDNDDVVAVFFDDNVIKRILGVKPLIGDYFEQKHLQNELIRLGRIVPVQTFKVCMENNYFINLVEAAYQSQLKLSRYLPLSEHGSQQLDAAIYCWAIRQLNPRVDAQVALDGFEQMSAAYHDDERYFHRGLGHPRSLLPDVAQLAYKSLLSGQHQGLTHEELMQKFDALISDKLNHPLAQIQEAQEIIAGFYHDVVHRKGKKPQALSKYLDGNGHYQAHQELVPMTRVLLNAAAAVKVEELSCIVAEDALSQNNIGNEYILPVLLAIYGTIPFTDVSHPDALRKTLTNVLHEMNITFTSAQVDSAINIATAVTNRDHGSYGEDALDEFNMKSWAMMLERNAKLAKAEHSIIDESKTISEFYESHKKLYQKVMAGEISIYHSLHQDDKVDQLNKNAQHTLQLDILLQGLQLGSLVIMMAILHKANQSLLSQPINDAINSSSVVEFLNKQEALANNNHLNEVPPEIVTVLEKHGSKCSVNGLSMMRGSCNGSMALRFASLIGIDALLQMADKFPNYQDVRLDEVFDMVSPSLARKPALLQFGSFKAPAMQPECLTSNLSSRYNT